MPTTTTTTQLPDYGVPPGKYGLAYRYYNSRRDVISGMSDIVTMTVEVGNAHFQAPELLNASPEGGFDTIQTFRTIDGGNRLYLEGSWESGEVPTWCEELSDEAIQYQERYEPNIDEVKKPPTSRRVAYYDSVILAEDTSLSTRGIRYSPTHKHQPEIFNTANLSRVNTEDGQLVEFVESGDYLFALYPSLVKRFFKQGTVCSENNLHRGWGPISRSCAVSLASSVVMLTPKGIVAVTPGSPPQLFPNANRLFVPQLAGSWAEDIQEDLNSPLPNIISAVDDLMGCAIFVNRAKYEALVYWVDTQRVTMLEDWPWTLMCTGSDPVNGGQRRCWCYGMEVSDSADTSFAAHTDKIWTIDALLEADTQTMFGLSSGQTLNGTATAGSSGSTLTCAGAGWTDEMVGAFVHIFSGSGENATGRRRSRIISVSSTELTLYPSAGTIEIGDEFHISCIPMVVMGTALAGEGVNTDLSFRRVVSDMNLCLGHGCEPSAGSYVRMAIVGEDGETEEAAKVVEASTDYDQMHANVSAQGRAVNPKWESWWSDEPMEWLQGRVKFRKGDSDVD